MVAKRPEAKTSAIARELQCYKIAIIVFCETHFAEEGLRTDYVAEYTFSWRGWSGGQYREADVIYAM